MKTPHAVLILTGLASMAQAREVKLAWDAAPAAEFVVGWRVWSGSTLLTASNVPKATVNVPNAATTLTVTAINAAGESPHSSALLTIPPAMVWIQRSTDLQTWTNVVEIPFIEPSQFVRIQIPPP